MREMLVVFCALGSDVKDVAVVMETLRAGVEEWQREVVFHSTFRLRSGFAKSVESGLRGELDPTRQGSSSACYEASGSFHKMGANVRFAIDFGSPVEAVGSIPQEGRKAPKVYRNVPLDESTDGRVIVGSSPRRGKLAGRAVVEEKPDASTLRAGTGERTGHFINPLNPLYGADWDPFGGLPAVTLNAVDEEHLEVVCFGRDEYGNERHRRVLFWTKPSRPLVTKVSSELVYPDGGRFGAYAALSDFKLCPGGYVARQVAFARQQRGGPVRAMVWRSEDLGDAPPSEEDFVVTIPADVWVMGLKNAQPAGTVRQLDPSKIKLSDVVDIEALDREREAQREGRGASTRFSGWFAVWGGMTLLVLILLSVGIRWYAVKGR